MNFKFEIGDWVYIAQDVRSWRERFGKILEQEVKRDYESMGGLAARERSPVALKVLERHLQQCYGGIQLHYHVRGGSGTVFTITEPELCDSLDA